VRLSLVAILVLAGAMVVGGCSGTLSRAPSVTASPSVLPSGPVTAASCTTADVQATGGPWGGAAGSRGADVSVSLKGATRCVFPARPVVAILDAHGVVVVQASPVVASSQPPLAAGSPASFSILFSNWCAPGPKLPFRAVLVVAGDTVEIAGLSLTTVDALPPCNGPGQPATISATDWQLR
jgi:uncharacterized protein DUF4232